MKPAGVLAFALVAGAVAAGTWWVCPYWLVFDVLVLALLGFGLRFRFWVRK